MKKLDFIKESKKVCRIKFECIFDGLLPLVDLVKVDFKKLVLSNPYDEDIELEYDSTQLQGYELETSKKGFMLSLFIIEPEKEDDYENSINYQLGESFEGDVEKSDITVTVEGESDKLELVWIPTIDDVFEREEYVSVDDDTLAIIENFKNIIPSVDVLEFLYKDVLKNTDKKNIERLSKISQI